MPEPAGHHTIKASELKSQLASIPDNTDIGFIADDTPCHFLELAPDRREGHEGAMRVFLRACPNFPPVEPKL